MTEILTRLLGRLPVGWLQLSHNKGRLAAAVTGVAFANILVFMQLGFLGALIESIRLPYERFDADIMISASDMNTLADSSPVPRQRMFEALAVDGVAAATPLYLSKIDWKQPDGTIRTLDVFGIDPTARSFKDDRINAARPQLTLADYAIIDDKTRNAPPGLFDGIKGGKTYRFETRGRALTVFSTFTIGGGLAADGYLILSDQTFLTLFPERTAGTPSHILIKLNPGADRRAVVRRLSQVLPSYDSRVQTVEQAIQRDVGFQTTQRPVGIVFGFGVVIGILVGIIIVYQVLSSDVADHIREYATFKAIGYPHRFFLGIVFEEAVILALLGFVPGTLLSLVLYVLVANKTGLPVEMPPLRPVLVLVGTIAMCSLSGFIATRRLSKADPAELF